MSSLASAIVRPLLRRVLPGAAALGCVVALGVVGAPSAGADSPTFEHFEGSFTDVDTETCGFPVTSEETFSVDLQFFYDSDGNLDHSIAHIELRGTVSANGVSLLDNANFTHTFDPAIELNADLGLQGLVRLPGGGVVAVEAGRVQFLEDGTVLFVAGHHDFLSGDLAAFCAALSP